MNFQIVFFEYTLTLTLFFIVGYEIENYGGNLFFNVMLLSVADILGSYISGIISLNIDLKVYKLYLFNINKSINIEYKKRILNEKFFMVNSKKIN